jgi:hypothetical protein
VVPSDTFVTYKIAPIEVPVAQASELPQLIKIPRIGGGHYFLSYRQLLGFDQGLLESYTQGLSIHSDSPQNGLSDSIRHPMLRDGRVFTDTASDLRIVQLGHDASGVTIQIGRASAVPPVTTAQLSGRLIRVDGQPVLRTRVLLTAADGTSRSALSDDSTGSYRFTNLPTTGETYTVSVQSRRYRFRPRTVQVTGNVVGFDMVGVE